MFGSSAEKQIANQLGHRVPIPIRCIEEHIQPLMHSIDLHALAGLLAVDGQVRQLHCL
jgi:hypothetical protein